MTRFAALVAALLTVPACATMSSGPQGIDPLGIYDFTTSIQGQQVSGTFRIESTESEVLGSVMAAGMPAMPILGIAVEDDWMTLRTNTGTNHIEIHLVFVGNDFTGEWTAYGPQGGVEDTGTLSGRKRDGTGGDGSGSGGVRLTAGSSAAPGALPTSMIGR